MYFKKISDNVLQYIVKKFLALLDLESIASFESPGCAHVVFV